MTRGEKVSIIIFNTVKRESARRKELSMIATVINVVLILLGSLLGLVCKDHIKPRFAATLTSALGLCVMGIGVSSMIGTQDTLCVIVCMVVGTLLGEALRIEDRLEGIGILVRGRLLRGGGNSRFVEGFVNATVLFCVGAMAINGSLEAGLNHNYSILISKSVIDGVTAITFASGQGMGVAEGEGRISGVGWDCAVYRGVVPLFLYQGGLTLLAQFVGPYLPQDVVVEMSAVGGTIIVGIALNMLGLPREKIRVGNMLPAMFLPMAYLPLSRWLTALM